MTVAFSPRDRTLASSTINGMIEIWDVAGGRRLSSIGAATPPRSRPWRIPRTAGPRHGGMDGTVESGASRGRR